MADKKISQFDHQSKANSNSYIPVVTNGANYRIQIDGLFENSAQLFTSTANAVSQIQSIVTVNANTPGNSVIAIRGQAQTNVSAGYIVGNLFGGSFEVLNSNANSNVTGTFAGLKVSVDTGTSNTLGNVYGIVIDSAQVSGTRLRKPNAFIALGEDSITNANTTYLMEIGYGSKHVSNSSAVSGAVILSPRGSSPAQNTASHGLKIRVNGADYWMLLSNVTPA